jgi:hypothetical protein
VQDRYDRRVRRDRNCNDGSGMFTYQGGHKRYNLISESALPGHFHSWIIAQLGAARLDVHTPWGVSLNVMHILDSLYQSVEWYLINWNQLYRKFQKRFRRPCHLAVRPLHNLNLIMQDHGRSPRSGRHNLCFSHGNSNGLAEPLYNLDGLHLFLSADRAVL